MKKILFLFALLSVSAYSQELDYKKRSEIVLEQFKNEDFSAVFKQIDTAVFTKVDTAYIARNWANVIKQNGKFVKKLKDERGRQGNFVVHTQLCQFEKKQVNFRLVWGVNEKIKGFYFVPVDDRPKYKTPDYYNPAAAREKKVVMTTENYRIPGSLMIPNTKGKHPLVILVHGSGANDRDETFGPLKPFKDISSGLTVQGVAVLRYEKRTRLFKSRMTHETPNYTVKQEVLEDVKRAIEVAKQDTTIDTNQIFICGHSFGGMLLPRIAKENPSIKGLIYLAPNARKLEDLFLAQAEYLAESITDPVRKNQVIDSVKNERERIKALTSKAALDSTMIFGSPVSLWYELRNYDPVATAQTLDMPMLFIFASRDYQVTSVDSEMWLNAFKSNEKVTFKMYPKLNHFFVEGEGKSMPSEYEKPGNVDIGLINDMASWLKGIK